MGFFDIFKKSSGEKLLNDIVGKERFNTDFLNRLNEHNLSPNDGYNIKNQIKEEIKANNLETHDEINNRIEELLKEHEKSMNIKRKAVKKVNELLGKTELTEAFKETLESKNLTEEEGFEIKANLYKEIENDTIKTEIEINRHIEDLLKEYENNIGNKRKTVKKVNELLGKTELTEAFKETLKSKDLSEKDGFTIKAQLYEEIEKGKLSSDDVVNRINEIIERQVKNKKIQMQNKISVKARSMLKLLNNQENFSVNCTKCGEKLYLTDKFCFKCGHEIADEIENKSYINTNTNLEATKKEEEIKDEDLTLLYNERIKTGYDSEFKFGYVNYLSALNSSSDVFEVCNKYDISQEDFEKQGLKDGFIEEIANINCFTMNEIKDVLRKYNLKVSGRKNELINRINENLSPEQAKEEFPVTSYVITQKGQDFIKDNDYVFIYEELDYLKEDLGINEFDNYIVQNKDKNAYELIEDYYKKIEDKVVSAKQWSEYKNIFKEENKFFMKKEDLDNSLKASLKVFILDVNNWVYDEEFQNNEIAISKNNVKILNKLLLEEKLDINQLKDLFNTAADEVKIPSFIIPKDKVFRYLILAFNGEDIDKLNRELRNS